MVALRHLIVYVVLPIIIFVLWVGFNFAGEDSAFWKVKNAALGTVDKAKEYLPEISRGLEEISGKTPDIPEDHEEAINSLANTIKEMLESDDENCFAKYSILPNLNEQGTIIELSENNMVVRILGGKQVVTDLSNELTEKVQDFQPCVIAGSEMVVENFAQSFLNEKGWAEKKQNIKAKHYNLVDNVIISYDLAGFDENRISYSVEKKFKDFEDGGYLYKPKEGIICFFPTVDLGSDEDGLNDDYLVNSGWSKSIPKQIEQGQLLEC